MGNPEDNVPTIFEEVFNHMVQYMGPAKAATLAFDTVQEYLGAAGLLHPVVEADEDMRVRITNVREIAEAGARVAKSTALQKKDPFKVKEPRRGDAM